MINLAKQNLETLRELMRGINPCLREKMKEEEARLIEELIENNDEGVRGRIHEIRYWLGLREKAHSQWKRKVKKENLTSDE